MTKLILILFLLLSCSSLPEKTYTKSKIKTIYINYLNVADNARINGNYPLALKYYDKAIEYAAHRNERKEVGIIHLKKGAIYLNQKNKSAFLNETQIVKNIIEIEKVDLLHSLNFIMAKFYYINNENEKANILLEGLIQKYKESPEQHTYYSFQYNKYNPSYLSIQKQTELIQMLNEKLEDSELENIEILSFCIFSYCSSLLQTKNKSFESEIHKALEFYKSIENQKRIKNCYKMLAEYYSGNKKRSEYYLELSN